MYIVKESLVAPNLALLKTKKMKGKKRLRLLSFLDPAYVPDALRLKGSKLRSVSFKMSL